MLFDHRFVVNYSQRCQDPKQIGEIYLCTVYDLNEDQELDTQPFAVSHVLEFRDCSGKPANEATYYLQIQQFSGNSGTCFFK